MSTAPMIDLRSQFAATTRDLLGQHKHLALVLADISTDRFATELRTYPDRVINVGIREQLMISVAGGLALSGLRPIAHTFGAFVIERAWEQIKLDLDHQDVGAVLVGGYGSYDWPQGGRTHQAPGDVALIDTLRNWTVHVPGHPAELAAQLRAAAPAADRVYLRIGGSPNSQPYPHDRWTRLTSGSQGVVVAVGATLTPTLAATRHLDLTVLYAPTVRPFGTAALRRAVETTAPVVIMVEPYLAGTSAAFVAQALADRAHRQLGIGVQQPDPHRYGTVADHDRIHGLDAAGIRQQVTSFLTAK